MAIAGYNFYENGVKLNASLLTIPNYVRTGLPTPGTTHSCYFTAVDTAGNESSAGDTKSVTLATVPTGNTPPVANAGADNTITLPTNSVTLVGSGTDSDGTIASYAWSKVSGGAATITTPNAATTTVTGLAQGSYVFRLTVTDNQGATHTDEVSITVNSASVVNDYSILSNLKARIDATGLQQGVANDFGSVDASGNLVYVKSVSPAPTGIANFNVVGTGVTVDAEGIQFNGSGNLNHATTSYWKFLHYNAAGIAALKHTTHFVVKLGNVADPNAAYGLMGTNGTSGSKIGDSLYWDDRASIPANNKIASLGSSGGGNNASKLWESVDNTAFPPNKVIIITRVVDCSLAGGNRLRFYIDGVFAQEASAINVNSTMSSAEATHSLDIGACGNNALRLVGAIKEVVIQEAAESDTVRTNFINWLKSKHSIV